MYTDYEEQIWNYTKPTVSRLFTYQDDLHRETTIANENVQNNQSVRSMLGQRGIKPDNLPPEEDLKNMKEDHLSVRKLAAEAEVSPTIIQNLKSEKKTNITIETLSKILDVIDYQIILAPKSDRGKQLKMA